MSSSYVGGDAGPNLNLTNDLDVGYVILRGLTNGGHWLGICRGVEGRERSIIIQIPISVAISRLHCENPEDTIGDEVTYRPHGMCDISQCGLKNGGLGQGV